MSGKAFAPNEYDILVGRMLMTMRLRFGMSQKDLADKAGITFQQIQKYETAGNRLSASRLHQIVTECFDMTLSEFFGEVDKPYNKNKEQTEIIRKFDNTNPDGHQLITKMVACIAQSYPKNTQTQ